MVEVAVSEDEEDIKELLMEFYKCLIYRWMIPVWEQSRGGCIANQAHLYNSAQCMNTNSDMKKEWLFIIMIPWEIFNMQEPCALNKGRDVV